MKDINKIILVGRLGGDPIQRKTKVGTPVVQFSVATSRRVLKDGVDSTAGLTENSFTEETQWHKVVAWGRQAEVCGLYLKKGQPVYVEGYLKSQNYEDKNGQTKTNFEVQAENVSFLGSKSQIAEKVQEMVQ